MHRPFLFTVLLLGAASSIEASSHREAPAITKDPTADNTDVYAFVSPDRPGTVTLIANYIPVEEPAGGPNFYNFDPAVVYAIHIDNDGDAREDITYEFRFTTRIINRNTFLYNTGPIETIDDPDFNFRQFYDVSVSTDGRSGRGQRTVIAENVAVPPSHIGPRSNPEYEAVAAEGVFTTSSGIKTFAGQRDDPFFVDIGSAFDLLGLRPFNPAHLIPLPAAPGVDSVGGFNVHTISLQVPIERLTRNGRLPTGPGDPAGVLGIYASASRQRNRHFVHGRWVGSGSLVQVSRLGNPLINEVIIPLGRKDQWNTKSPEDDAAFLTYYLEPELARLINALYPALPDAPETNRTDLVAVLLTGIPGLNFTGERKADLLRLNTGIPPTAAVGAGNPLGVLAGDLAGFPNGRRLEDDVTDIELRAVACGYGSFVEGLLGLCNLSPNNTLKDGVDVNDRTFLPSFPYVSTPHQGYEHVHHPTGS